MLYLMGDDYKGRVDVYIDDEKFEVEPGKFVIFDGDENHIYAEMIEDSEAFVTIVDK